MATQTLPGDFIPDKQGCLRTNDYWIWDYEVDRDARTVLGGPSQTSDCFPSTWAATVTYEGSQCPPQYTSACGGGESAAVTCCPTGAYNFVCQAEDWPQGVHGEQFRCKSKHTSEGTMVITRTAFKKNVLKVETRTRKTNEHLFALAMMYTTPTSTSTSSTVTETATTGSSSTLDTISQTSTPEADSSESSSSNTLSTAEAAGVGVGVALAVLLLAGLLAWFVWRRRRSSRESESVHEHDRNMEYVDSPKSGMPLAYPPVPVPSSPAPSELPTFRAPAELQTEGSIPYHNLFELPSSTTPPK